MIGLMVVIGVVLMISLMSSPFMSGLEGFQEGATPSPSPAPIQQSAECNSYTKNCPSSYHQYVKELYPGGKFRAPNGAYILEELVKPENKNYNVTVKNRFCKQAANSLCPSIFGADAATKYKYV